MKTVILAAGKATRIAEHIGGGHKALIEYDGEALLLRLLRQVIQAGYSDISIVVGHRKKEVAEALSDVVGIELVENRDFEKDKNIHSLLLAYPPDDEDLLIIECDVVMSDSCVPLLRNMKSSENMIWATNGKFHNGQAGAILHADQDSRVTHLKYVDAYQKEYDAWHKNLAAMYIPARMSSKFRDLLKNYAAKTWQHYYIDPLIDNLSAFDSVISDFGYDRAGSFNTIDELHAVFSRIEKPHRAPVPPIELINPKMLRHIEDFDRERVARLKDQILSRGMWIVPICVDRQTGAVMDGQHRMEVADTLDLKRIPAVLFDYKDVSVWSLRPKTFFVTQQAIVDRTLSGNIYPYKTAKHKFPVKIPECRFPLEELR